MPPLKRRPTNYPGVFYLEGVSVNGRPEKIYYIRYRKAGKMIEEKAGRQYQDDMTPSRAASLRAAKIDGKEPSRKEGREARAVTLWTVDRLWQEYIGPKPDTKSFQTDRYRFQKFLQAPLGKEEPQDISQIELHRLKIKLAKTLSAKTVKNVLELFERIVNFGVKKGLCQGLKFKIEMPKLNNCKTEFLTDEQLSDLLAAIDADYDTQAGTLLKLALGTGMRRGELLKLQWEDVDFENGFIHIRQPKGGKDQIIPLNQIARELLELHPHTSLYVFPGPDGGQCKSNFRRSINRIKAAAGLPEDFRPCHGLRHHFASMLASSGQVDLYTLQRLLTHTTPDMTQRYAHLRDKALQAAANVASDILAQAGNKVQSLKIRKGNER